MTISSQTSRISYTGNGATTAFSVPFYFAANSDLVVSVQDTSGIVTTKLLGTDYTLTGATLSAGGTATFTTAPTTGYIIAITRVPPITQTTSYNNNDPFPAASHELALDKLTTISQYLKNQVDRAILVDPTDVPPMTTLPVASLRALKTLSFDSLGNPTVTTPVTGSVVSAAMIPVTTASTLPLARAALGVADTIVAISSNTAISTAAQNSNRYIATGALNLTLARANTFTNGFGFWLEVVSTGGDVTLVPDANDTIATALAAGQNVTIPAGAKVFIGTDAAASGAWYIEGLPFLVSNVLTSGITGTITIARTHNARIISNNSNVFGTFAFPAAATLQSDFRTMLMNGGTTAGVSVTGVGSQFILWPGQSCTVMNIGGTLTLAGQLPRWTLQSDTTWYVGYTSSSDANDGLSTTSSFATIQKGVDAICNFVNINRKNVVLQINDGTYAEAVHLYVVTGWGTIGGHSELCIRGNLTTPANCIVSVASNCFSMVGCYTPWRIEGFKMIASAGEGISCDGSSFVYIGKNDFGVCSVAHIGSSYKSFVEVVAGYTISGASPYHFNAFTQSLIITAGPITITLTGTPAFATTFASANAMSSMDLQGTTFSGAATGQRYALNLNSLINTGGGGAAFIPGNAGGTNDASSVYA